MKQLFLFIVSLIAFCTLGAGCEEQAVKQSNPRLENLMVRIAELEIEPQFIEEYLAILKEESGASVQLEPGVICIFPMFEKENPYQIRLLEIYASKEAYESHLQSPHFKHYKEATLHMVRSLELIDMEAIDQESMPEIFMKIQD